MGLHYNVSRGLMHKNICVGYYLHFNLSIRQFTYFKYVTGDLSVYDFCYDWI